jgi:hypothetical protein
VWANVCDALATGRLTWPHLDAAQEHAQLGFLLSGTSGTSGCRCRRSRRRPAAAVSGMVAMRLQPVPVDSQQVPPERALVLVLQLAQHLDASLHLSLIWVCLFVCFCFCLLFISIFIGGNKKR